MNGSGNTHTHTLTTVSDGREGDPPSGNDRRWAVQRKVQEGEMCSRRSSVSLSCIYYMPSTFQTEAHHFKMATILSQR